MGKVCSVPSGPVLDASEHLLSTQPGRSRTGRQGHKQNQNETCEAFKGWIKYLAEIQRVPSFTSSQFGNLCVTPIKLAQLKSGSGAFNLHSSRNISAARLREDWLQQSAEGAAGKGSGLQGFSAHMFPACPSERPRKASAH